MLIRNAHRGNPAQVKAIKDQVAAADHQIQSDYSQYVRLLRVWDSLPDKKAEANALLAQAQADLDRAAAGIAGLSLQDRREVLNRDLKGHHFRMVSLFYQMVSAGCGVAEAPGAQKSSGALTRTQIEALDCRIASLEREIAIDQAELAIIAGTSCS